MTKTRVGVVRGGPSNEYEVSLQTGANILSALREKLSNKYDARDVFIDREGNWHIDGVAGKAQDVLGKIDVAFIGLHGTYGEDGKLQGLLESMGTPFTGSGSLASSLGMNKIMAKKIFEQHGIKTPHGKAIPSKDIQADPKKIAYELFRTFPIPAVVKPAASGSSVGVSIANTLDELLSALIEAAKHDDTVLIEEFIKGDETTIGVIEGFRGEDLYALPAVLIKPRSSFFDYEAKYTAGGSEDIVPAPFPEKIKTQLAEFGRKIHDALGLRHYSRSDFIIHPKRGIYALEVNTLPGFADESLVPKALRAVGSDVSELVDHLVQLALDKD